MKLFKTFLGENASQSVARVMQKFAGKSALRYKKFNIPSHLNDAFLEWVENTSDDYISITRIQPIGNDAIIIEGKQMTGMDDQGNEVLEPFKVRMDFVVDLVIAKVTAA